MPAVDVLAPTPDRAAILAACRPAAGRPACGRSGRPGRALVTVDVPMGDTDGAELELLADLADRYADGT